MEHVVLRGKALDALLDGAERAADRLFKMGKQTNLEEFLAIAKEELGDLALLPGAHQAIVMTLVMKIGVGLKCKPKWEQDEHRYEKEEWWDKIFPVLHGEEKQTELQKALSSTCPFCKRMALLRA